MILPNKEIKPQIKVENTNERGDGRQREFTKKLEELLNQNNIKDFYRQIQSNT